MNKTTNTTMNTNLYFLEDAATGTIVAINTSVEALVEAFLVYGSQCRFYKLVDGRLLDVANNELPEGFVYGYDDAREEYGDCAYCPVCSYQW